MEVLQTAQIQEVSLRERTASVVQTLDEMFPEQERYGKEIKVAKQILGEVADEFTPEELKNVVVEIQFLCESWLDDFERTVFDGQTLKELLHDKGGR
jgi:hypothetical protein